MKLLMMRPRVLGILDMSYVEKFVWCEHVWLIAVLKERKMRKTFILQFYLMKSVKGKQKEYKLNKQNFLGY